MLEGLMLFAALACNLIGMAWLALAMDVHWEQALGTQVLQPRSAVVALRVLGAVAIGASLALCLAVDHVSQASLVWVMTLAVSAMAVAFTLTTRPRALAPLVMWARGRPA